MTRPFLAPLPCGCAVDPDQMRLDADVLGVPGFEGAVISCPWCDAVFSAVDYHDWYAAGKEVFMQRDRILEIVGMCNCGQVKVRELCEKQVVHLDEAVPVQMMRN